ncbi:MAG TPA: hypothetical protein VLZ81_14280 [Blastocatellia bacterium]|nr:hypothetical protein [Blastocatellia bacterium]
MKMLIKLTVGLLIAACLVATGFSSKTVAASDKGDEKVAPEAAALPILPQILPATTVPGNGDLNPYGVAFVPSGFHTGGVLNPGDILVSNFNNSNNAQGTGTTIVRIQPNGQTSPFFQSTVNGLSTALGIIPAGFIVVGNVPTQDGTCGTLGAGSLQVINYKDQLIQTITDPLLDSPWDMQIIVQGQSAMIFVSNVVSGTVTRLDVTIKHGLHIQSKVQIASGYNHSCTAASFVIGPTGLAYDQAHDVLYVASTGDNTVFAIDNASKVNQSAGMGRTVYSDAVHLHGPLVLLLTPNGDLLVSNGDAVNPDPNQTSEIVEFTPQGEFVSEFSVDAGAGGAFGMNLQSLGGGFLRFAAVDDVNNSLRSWIISQ